VQTLSQLQINRALLARQGLLERAGMPLPRALEQVGGIQAQYAPSMYIGLWSRLEHFERDALTAALEQRTVVQATLLRITIHLVSARDFWPFALATRAARRALWLRATPDAPGAPAMAGAARVLRRRLARDGQLRRTGLLPEEHRPKLFSTSTPHSFPTFLVDGAVAGKWRHERGAIELEPFRKLDAATRRALAAEGERLAAFLA